MFIIATVGIASWSENSIRKMILGGADILRFNFSYKINTEHPQFIELSKQLIDELNASTKILVDLPNHKIRLGDFDAKMFSVKEGEQHLFKSLNYSPDCNEFIPVDTPKIGTQVHIDQTITIGDGEVSLQVKEIVDADTINAVILNNGIINYSKTFNYNHFVDDQVIVQRYATLLQKIIDLDIDPSYIAISFLNEKTNNQIKNLPLWSKCHSKVLYKIEHKISDKEIEAICNDPFCSMIILDRGELGVNMPYEGMGIYQKHVITLAKKYKKPIIISSQILESTIKNYIPMRSDILDLTNIVIDGANGIMLCMETAANPRPVYTLSVAKKIITATQKNYKL